MDAVWVERDSKSYLFHANAYERAARESEDWTAGPPWQSQTREQFEKIYEQDFAWRTSRAGCSPTSANAEVLSIMADQNTGPDQEAILRSLTDRNRGFGTMCTVDYLFSKDSITVSAWRHTGDYQII